jgi:hypothetical protein
MSSVYKSAALAGLLPNAQMLIDFIHIIQLANKMVRRGPPTPDV